MDSMAREAVGGYNGFLESHQKAPGEASVMASKRSPPAMTSKWKYRIL
jgi:hypothetical protein